MNSAPTITSVSSAISFTTLRPSRTLPFYVDALTPGGRSRSGNGNSPARRRKRIIVGDAFALYFRLTSTSRLYTGEEYAGWLSATGYEDVQVRRSPMSPRC
jgi:hypothetical protein